MDEKTSDKRLAELEAKWLAGTITDEEAQEYARWYAQNQDRPVEVPQSEAESRDGYEHKLLGNILQSIDEEETVTLPKKKKIILWRYAAAAAVLFIIGIGGYFVLRQNGTRVTAPPDLAASIAPGHDGAVLTLADGSKVVLDSLHNGVIAQQNGAQVVLQNRQVTYTAAGNNLQSLAYNEMSTPRGRQFRVQLPDGTQVWLNAESSIRYPTVFTGNERRVAITGEAYFEVAKDASKPFRVNVDGKATVEVLGTHFDINAYTDETTWRTTLLEGSVRMYTATGDGKVVLKPGEQARLQAAAPSSIQVEKNIDIDKVIAWKNGLFNFEGMRLREVMRQFERWYDIQVVYEGNVNDIEFYGKIGRNNTLEDVLDDLKDLGVHFRITDRKLMVYP